MNIMRAFFRHLLGGVLSHHILSRSILVMLLATGSSQALEMSDSQREELLRIAPGLELTEELVQQLRAIVYDSSLSVDERIQAMQQLTGFSPAEPLKRKLCVWDIAGRSGPIYGAARDQAIMLLEYGIDIDLHAYTNEGVLSQDLQAGICDAALMTGLRGRLFNRFAGSIDAVGAVPSETHMRMLLQVLADPRMADKMESGEYVILGLAPAGAAYVFVNDRAINSLAAAAGKRVAVLDYDETQARMVAQVGATPVATDIAQAPNRFNNGVVDVLPAPLVAYEVMELYRGMSPDGGIVDYPLAQITMQLIGRRDKFPTEIAQLVREAFFEGYDEIMMHLRAEEEKVPERWWIAVPEEDKQEYEVMMQEARLQLREEGYYDPEMLRLQRRIRCRIEPGRYECANPLE